ncbi:MAG: hypothetical protein ETSY2_18990 [Candidatus Entotheonella gemina]|uniref:Uncharacterized protein n=2 Tax=Candidatus Entotheonella TaxID=93171 RepID=W4M876_9BACT|nr:MAG: hypothetical protein ETSY2_18990 [Candidatus Entotheonella gemina]
MHYALNQLSEAAPQWVQERAPLEWYERYGSRAGRTRDWTAAMLNLSSDQVQTAMDYIHDHDTQVNTEYDAIMTRIRKGNPIEVEAQLRANREKVKARLADQETTSR